ncbi:MAG: amidohydrolase family protein [Ignavibacteriae bacterium]|nr:amidohydrolase family protein [Ignavibacteriota bacterium]MCB9216555.1 amidohydrolase family protein [Ignavibacteria bacterium]
MKRKRYVLLTCSILLLLLCQNLSAQRGGEKGREAPDIPVVTHALAISNVRIVVRPGQVIERGTVLMRDGLIESVGTDLIPPYDARVIDGTGLTVYAGFIDGYSFAGAPKPENQNDSVAKPGDPPNARAGITPERDIRELLNRQDSFIDSLRRVGFGVAHTAPRGGMLPGTGGLLLLGGRDTNRLFLTGGTSLVATFDGANDVYPATPMGIMAKFRNLYHQAEQLKEQDRWFKSNPNGYLRPDYDPVRSSFFPTIDGSVPVFFRVNDDLEARRALVLRKELGFPLVLVGLKDGRDVADLIRNEKLPLFLSLDFPEAVEDEGDSATKKRDDSESESEKVPPNDSTSRRVPPPMSVDEYNRLSQRVSSYLDIEGERNRLIAIRDESHRTAVSLPAAYSRAGTKFGFSTAGTKGNALRSNLIEAVRHGLPEDRALAALTTDAAEMIGAGRALGTVEAGKIANLVVTTGPYFHDTSKVRMTIVDGILYDYSGEGKKGKGKKDDSASAGEKMPILFATNVAEPIVPGRIVAMNRDQSGNILIKNATVLTVTNGTLEETDVLVERGKITSIGKGLGAPSGITVIDGTGKYLMPGIIDAHSHIAVSGPVNEWTNPVTAEVQIEDVVDPYDITIYRALAGGVTTSHVMHGSANAIGGQCETIKHRYGEVDPAKLKMEGAPRTIKFALGENPTRVHGRGFGVPPSSRMGVEQVFREAFTKAQRYMVEWDRYNKEKGEKGKRPIPPQYDERMEALADILRGEILIHCHSYRADEILMLMRVLKDFGITRITFQHVNEGFKVAKELAAFGAMASVFSDWWAYKFEVYYSTAYNAAVLTRNGVVTSINSDSPELNRHLYHEAAKSMKHGGLTEDECLAMITINPAKQLGVEDRIGSIEVGKEGDLALFSGHPLSIYSQPILTVVDGVIRFDAENDPDDMRLKVNPEEKIDAVMDEEVGEDDGCMEGVKGR